MELLGQGREDLTEWEMWKSLMPGSTADVVQFVDSYPAVLVSEYTEGILCMTLSYTVRAGMLTRACGALRMKSEYEEVAKEAKWRWGGDDDFG
jgi:hypothetical protein